LALLPRGRLALLAAWSLAVGLAEVASVVVLYLVGVGLTQGGTLPPGLPSRMVSALAGHWHMEPLVLAGLLLLGAAVARAALSLVNEALLAQTQTSIGRQLTRELFAGYFGMSYEHFSARNTTDRVLQITNEAKRAGSASADL